VHLEKIPALSPHNKSSITIKNRTAAIMFYYYFTVQLQVVTVSVRTGVYFSRPVILKYRFGNKGRKYT